MRTYYTSNLIFMTKFFQVFISAIYVILIIFSFLILLELCGFRFSGLTVILIMTGWVLFCFYSAYFRTPLDLLFFHKLRRPVAAEKWMLDRCFREVLKKAGCSKQFRLLIDESEGIGAYATGHNIIAVSRNALEYFTEEELKGVLAHELGHLLSKDCIILTAMRTASDLPRIVSFVFARVSMLLETGFAFCDFLTRRVSALLGVVILILSGIYLYKWGLLIPIIGVAAFVFLSNFQWRIFRFFTLLTSRFTEYKQDAFACELGYGPELREALLKISQEGPQKVNRYQIIMNSTHPIIHNRIRKLEELTGMRA